MLSRMERLLSPLLIIVVGQKNGIIVGCIEIVVVVHTLFSNASATWMADFLGDGVALRLGLGVAVLVNGVDVVDSCLVEADFLGDGAASGLGIADSAGDADAGAAVPANGADAADGCLVEAEAMATASATFASLISASSTSS